MRILLLCLLLFFINYSYAICDYGFDRPMDRQFVDMIERHFTTYEMFLQREVRKVVNSYVREERGRKEVLQQLIDTGYLTIENSPDQNRLFRDILNRPPEAVIKAIRGNPNSLYNGTLLNLPPFFLIVFVGERGAMQASIKVDKALVNSKNSLQEVPLHYTVDPDIAGDLLRNHAKPNEPDKKGRVGLHNMRNPETVKVMLYYNADSMVRDRSGVSLIKFHREQVGDQEIVNLLEQARESQKSENGTRTNKKLVVNQKTEKEIKAEEEQRRLAAERRVAAEKRANEKKVEKKRLAEEKRIARRVEVEETNRRIMEERKNEMLSNLASVMASAMMAKASIKEASSQTVDIGVFSNVESTLRNMREQSSSIVIYNKEYEGKFEKELDEVMRSVAIGKLPKEYETEVQKIAKSKAQELEDELLIKLKDEIGFFSLGKLRGMLKKTEGHFARFRRMINQITKN